MLLSNARNHTERSIKAYEMIGQHAENPDVKEALKAREFVAEDNIRALDQCFEMIGEKPVQFSEQTPRSIRGGFQERTG